VKLINLTIVFILLQVLLASAVCTRSGKALLSRQFVEMSKARIEGLLAAFPKLMPAGVKQHTFVETDSVRYVYQPTEKLYVLLITTKTSNILEDLETLRLFARVVPEYCRSMDESEIVENAFQIIFAFDEIVALGYRESVNLAQIRTFVEMDSHEEKVYQAVRQTQEREAKQKMREKAKELQRQRMNDAKRGGAGGGGGGMGPGFGSDNSARSSSSGGVYSGVSVDTPAEPPKPTFSAAPRKPMTSKAMKLGGKSKDVDSFVDQLKSEGEHVTSDISRSSVTGKKTTKVSAVQQVKAESVHIKLEEKLTVVARRDGGLETMEMHGQLTMRIADESFGRIKLQLKGHTNELVQLQTHPNIDRELLKTKTQIALKNPARPFPSNTDVGVLKWRIQTTDESNIPLSINCWPSDNGQGGCDVNIEYELEQDQLELQDVVITIPIAHGSGTPVVAECDGDYTYEKRGALLWQLPMIDAKNKTGSIEFSCGGNPDDFFPVQVAFFSKKSYSGIEVLDCYEVDSESVVKHSTETILVGDRYEIV